MLKVSPNPCVCVCVAVDHRCQCINTFTTGDRECSNLWGCMMDSFHLLQDQEEERKGIIPAQVVEGDCCV